MGSRVRRTLGPGLFGRVDGGVLQVGGDVLEVRSGRGAVQRLVVLQQRQVIRVRLEMRLQALRVEQLQAQLLRPSLRRSRNLAYPNPEGATQPVTTGAASARRHETRGLGGDGGTSTATLRLLSSCSCDRTPAVFTQTPWQVLETAPITKFSKRHPPVTR